MQNTPIHTPTQTVLTYLLITFPLVLIATLISIFYLDKPTAIYFNHLFTILITQYSPWASPMGVLSGHLFNLLTELSYLLITLFLPIYFFAKLSQASQKKSKKKSKFYYFLDSLGFMSLTMALAFFIKSSLQFFFGRFGPRYADSSQLLFLRNSHLYGFDWLHQAGSFPSGHMCVYGAGLTVLMIYYPKLKYLFLILGLLLGLGLLLLNYHFLSDVIFGSYLGISTALGMFYYSKFLGAPLSWEIMT